MLLHRWCTSIVASFKDAVRLIPLLTTGWLHRLSPTCIMLINFLLQCRPSLSGSCEVPSPPHHTASEIHNSLALRGSVFLMHFNNCFFEGCSQTDSYAYHKVTASRISGLNGALHKCRTLLLIAIHFHLLTAYWPISECLLYWYAVLNLCSIELH